LPGATIEGLALPVTIASGANEQKEFDIVVPPSANTPQGVNHIRITAQLTPDKDQTFPTTFITPTEKTQSPAQ
jgi:hypothetical protein